MKHLPTPSLLQRVRILKTDHFIQDQTPEQRVEMALLFFGVPSQPLGDVGEKLPAVVLQRFVESGVREESAQFGHAVGYRRPNREVSLVAERFH